MKPSYIDLLNQANEFPLQWAFNIFVTFKYYFSLDTGLS